MSAAAKKAKVPVGVIGVGHLGSLHAQMFAEIPTAEFAGVYDIDRARADSVAAKFGTRSFPSAEALLDRVEAVSIATPTVSHFAVAKQALEHGKHVFIEKPLTETVREGEKLAALARRSSLKIQTGHIERFNPALLALEGYKLAPMFIESHRLAQFNPRGTDVAVVLDLMIHDIDIILSLVRSSVRKIEANGISVVSDSIDIANARLQFANGCVANVTASRISQKRMRKMRLFQRDAYISIDFSDPSAEVFRLADAADGRRSGTMMLGQIDRGSVKRNILYERPPIKKVNALEHELELFVEAVRRNREPIVTAEDGIRALKVAHDIIRAIGRQKLGI